MSEEFVFYGICHFIPEYILGHPKAARSFFLGGVSPYIFAIIFLFACHFIRRDNFTPILFFRYTVFFAEHIFAWKFFVLIFSPRKFFVALLSPQFFSCFTSPFCCLISALKFPGEKIETKNFQAKKVPRKKK